MSLGHWVRSGHPRQSEHWEKGYASRVIPQSGWKSKMRSRKQKRPLLQRPIAPLRVYNNNRAFNNAWPWLSLGQLGWSDQDFGQSLGQVAGHTRDSVINIDAGVLRRSRR